MYSLFGKIFLWFWLTMIAMGAIIALTTAQLGGEKIPPMIERAQTQFAEDGARAAQVLGAGGIDALRDWARRAENVRSLRLFVFDAEGREALGQAVPGPLRRFSRPLDGAGEHGSELIRERRGLLVYAVPVEGEGVYRLALLFRPPHPAWHLFSFQGLLAALVLSGLVCLGLARYVAAPVRRLRAATQGLAGGDLDMRVGDALARRRDEMGGLGRDFDRMAERLQEVIESQQCLLRDVSHELRSPLARLQAALGLARQRTGDLAAEELDRIERETERLNELIGQVLSLTRLTTDAHSLLREPIDLGALLQNVAEDAEFEAAQRDRHVTLCADEDVTISGDPELLHRALENVVRNAVYYTDEHTAVELALQRGAAGAIITVRDRGPGTSEDALGRIFDPFFRASGARERASGGHGLGLAIARRAVELHGGTIGAENVPDGGLLLRICLPLART